MIIQQMSKSEMVFNIAILIRDGVITIENLDGFSEELKEYVQLILSRRY